MEECEDDDTLSEEELKDLFQKAASHVRKMNGLPDEQMLLFYGLYKQALDGKCNIPKPHFWDFVGKAKWEAWKKLGDLPEYSAMEQYISLTTKIDPAWKEKDNDNYESGNKSSRGMGLSVSKMMNEEDETYICDDDKTVFDWCKDGNLEKVMKLLQEHSLDIDARDEQKMTLLHWASDRGHEEIVCHLIEQNADINAQDIDLQTPLHYAVVCEHKSIVKKLIDSGADQLMKDSEGLTPIDCSESQYIRGLFQ